LAKQKEENMLQIKDLHAKVEDNEILKGINLDIKPGEIHAIMGRNGSGKSTLANIISGKDKYTVTAGDVVYKGKSILETPPELRSLEGIFMSFQYPVVIPGVNNTYFLKAALNALKKHRGEDELDAIDFLELIKEKMNIVKMDDTYLKRAVNDGFSGGEKKKNEILQMITLEPSLSILDETDSGLDIDALKIVANGVNQFRSPDRSFLLITHYQRLLDYIVPDFVHVMIDGKIVLSGDKSLAHTLEEKGYGWLEKKKA